MKYDTHFLLDTHTVKEYVKDVVGLFRRSSSLQAEEIGDGNINYVFRVWDENKSVVVKQADVLLRSSGRPLDVYRNSIEARVLQMEQKLAPGYVPHIYFYDDKMHALTMEDISMYKNLRKELIAYHTYDHFAHNISIFMAQTLLPTTDLVCDRAEKKRNMQIFTNIELCDITEDLVLTEPYYDYKNRNVILAENQKFVEENLYHNDALKANVACLRQRFINYSQSLIHGDLHSGSIFINEQGIKVIDPEFSFYGPMGYDIGNVIGNLFFAWARAVYKNEDPLFQDWCRQTIEGVLIETMEQLDRVYEQRVTFPLYQEPDFKKQYFRQIFSDSLGYAGTEIIRRVVGDSKVAEITTMEDPTQRIAMERALIRMGIYLINERTRICRGREITEQFQTITGA